MDRGFLRTAAPLSSDLSVIAEIGMAIALLAGMALARRQRHRAHAWCQSAVVLLNLAVVILTMAPSFSRSFIPMPGHIARTYYLLAAVHAGLGSAAELLGLYILLVAGTNILPERVRFTRYKVWMRATLLLWWLALLLGLATYARWYVAPLRSR